MSTLLALDTATEACSVALLHDGKVTSHYEVIPRLHAQKLLPMIQQLLADAGTTLQAVDAIAFGRGPGRLPVCGSPLVWCKVWPLHWIARCCRCRTWRCWHSARIANTV